MSTKRTHPFLVAAAAALFAAALGCPKGDDTRTTPPAKATGAARESGPVRPAPSAPAAPAAVTATAQLTGLAGSTVTGTVTFRDTGNGINIEAHAYGLTPGRHGFHVHENGDCSGDGTSAGPHFNPGNASHGGPDSMDRHAGDLGNLIAGPDGHAMLSMISRTISLVEGQPNSIIGRAVLVHASEDDLTTDPAGNSGARIACGLVRMGSPVGGATGATGAVPTGPTGASGY